MIIICIDNAEWSWISCWIHRVNVNYADDILTIDAQYETAVAPFTSMV